MLSDYGITTARDIIAKNIKQEYFVDGILQKYGQVILTAKSGIGKTHFALQLCVSLLDEEKKPFLGKFRIPTETPVRNILFLNGENSSVDMKSKFINIENNITKEKADKINDRILFLTKRDIATFTDNFDNAALCEYIDTVVKIYDVDIFFIDNLQCFSTKPENENEQMRALLNKITNLAVKNDLTVFLIHHSGKGPNAGLRGASSIRDWATHVFVLEEGKENNVLTLQNTKNRSAAPLSTETLDFDGYVMTVSKNRGIQLADIAVEVLKNAGGKFNTKGGFVEAVCKYTASMNINASKNDVNEAIESAVADKRITVKKLAKNASCYTLIA